MQKSCNIERDSEEEFPVVKRFWWKRNIPYFWQLGKLYRNLRTNKSNLGGSFNK